MELPAIVIFGSKLLLFSLLFVVVFTVLFDPFVVTDVSSSPEDDGVVAVVGVVGIWVNAEVVSDCVAAAGDVASIGVEIFGVTVCVGELHDTAVAVVVIDCVISFS